MSTERLPDRLQALSSKCILVGGILTALLILSAFILPDRRIEIPSHAAHAVHAKAHAHGDDAKHDADAHNDDAHKGVHDDAHAENGDGDHAAKGAAEPHQDGDEHDGDHEKKNAAKDPHAGDDHGAHDGEKQYRTAIFSPAFQEAYMIGFYFILAPTLGALFWLCIVHLTTGGWGFVIRRVLEASIKNIWLVALLFLPIVIPVIFESTGDLEDGTPNYEAASFVNTPYDTWLDEDMTNPHSITATKKEYLNQPFFLLRALLYFVIWWIFCTAFYRWSVKQDETGNLVYRRRMKFWAGPCIILAGMAMTFASFDWAMSMRPEWFSSIYGVIFLIGQGLETMAFSIIMVCWLSQWQPIKGFLSQKRLHNLGNLMFAFVILWAYTNLAQFIIIWSANLPEEVTWYMNRAGSPFTFISAFLVIFHFALPFLILLSRHTKQHSNVITLIAAGIIFMRVVDLFWHVAPSLHPFTTDAIAGKITSSISFWNILLDFFAPVALGLLWLGFFFRNLGKLPLLATKDPNFSPHYDWKEAAS